MKNNGGSDGVPTQEISRKRFKRMKIGRNQRFSGRPISLAGAINQVVGEIGVAQLLIVNGFFVFFIVIVIGEIRN